MHPQGGKEELLHQIDAALARIAAKTAKRAQTEEEQAEHRRLEALKLRAEQAKPL